MLTSNLTQEMKKVFTALIALLMKHSFLKTAKSFMFNVRNELQASRAGFLTGVLQKVTGGSMMNSNK